MRPEQRIVAVGVAVGAVLMALSVWVLMRLLTPPQLTDVVTDRLGYALRANVFAILPLIVMFVTIANARFMSDAIDPTWHAESRGLEIDRRVAGNTLEQNFVFVVASLAMSTIVPLHDLQVVWACAIVFVVARGAFWLGYRINPLYRAAGMAATAFLNLAMVLYVVFHLA
jgi:MAPEG family